MFDLSLAALIVWISSAYFREVSKSPTIIALLIDGYTFFSKFVGIQATLFTCSLRTGSVVLSLGPDPCGWATPMAGPATPEGSSAPVAWSASLLSVLGQFVD